MHKVGAAQRQQGSAEAQAEIPAFGALRHAAIVIGIPGLQVTHRCKNTKMGALPEPLYADQEKK